MLERSCKRPGTVNGGNASELLGTELSITSFNSLKSISDGHPNCWSYYKEKFLL